MNLESEITICQPRHPASTAERGTTTSLLIARLIRDFLHMDHACVKLRRNASLHFGSERMQFRNAQHVGEFVSWCSSGRSGPEKLAFWAF